MVWLPWLAAKFNNFVRLHFKHSIAEFTVRNNDHLPKGNNLAKHLNRIVDNIRGIFTDAFQQTPLIVRSPGRINIIGEHTDYNEGFVLPAAIDKAAYIAVALRDDEEIHINAADLGQTFKTTIAELRPEKQLGWPNYIIGSAAQFLQKGLPLKGFNAVLSSDVPIGAGLSSSAAVECATVFALNELLKTGLDRITMVHMAQRAEHEFAGVMCGIMDQFASMMGKKDHLIKLDCRSLEYEYIPFKLDGIKVLLLNTNVKHALASSEYNTRREECEAAVSLIRAHWTEVRSLRNVSEAMLDECVKPVNDLIDKRGRYVVQEIERLQLACDVLQKGDISTLGKLMYATHEGLSSMYEVSCKELDWLVDQVRDNDAVLGARMMGGGFGGCTINLIQENAISPLVDTLKKTYEETHHLPLTYYIASIDDGTEVL